MKDVLLVVSCFLCATLSNAQELVNVRAFRHDTAEIRAILNPDANGHFTVEFAGRKNTLATVSTRCATRELQPDQVCVQVHQGKTVSHQHVQRPASLTQNATVIFRRKGHVFDVLTPQELIARIPTIQSFKGKVNASNGADNQPTLTDVKYQRLLPITFGDDFMRTDEEAKSFGLWNPIAGNWKIYSVMERIHANPAANIRPGKIPVADRSPNPFTLSGTSAQQDQSAIIVTGYPFWCDYKVQVTAKPSMSTCGLVFAFQNPDNFWSLQWTLKSLGTKPAPLKLVQVKNGKQIVHAAALVDGRSDNWAKIAVQFDGQHITAFIDNVPVIKATSNECTGGQAGLMAIGQQETHFDDFSVTSPNSYTIDTPEKLRAFTAETTDAQQLDWSIGMIPPFTLSPQKTPSTLTFGRDDWEAQRFQTTIDGKNAAATLAFGPKQRFQTILKRSNGKLTLQLADNQQTRKSITLDYAADNACVAIDYSRKNIVEIWLDNILALRDEIPNLTRIEGPVALTALEPNTTFSNLQFFVEHNRNWEQPVDITRFANDPYMQGWASNRYAWLRTKPQGTFPQRFNFTGDVYGAFSLSFPIINNLNFVFGNDNTNSPDTYKLSTNVNVKDASTTFTLTKSGKSLATATLKNLTHKIIPGIQIIDEKIGARPRTPDTPSWGTVTLHRDGYLLWLEYNGKSFLEAMDTTPLTGRQISADVPSNIDFIHLDLRREHVMDYLFEKAECDWAATGRWEVTNRFACDPRWSHMNGESFGVASLWSKFKLQGDFTIECFAGMRMRQGDLKEHARMNYPRVGDINIAVNADGHNLFSGYNLIIAAWDETWSETWTRFMKKDKILAQTDEELIPRGRVRSPSKRPVTVDWDPGGRPVHGAWYALKLRKTGNQFDAWFDNKHILSVKDDNPIEATKQIALWTQHNSIVLARVKVNYRHIETVSPASVAVANAAHNDSPILATLQAQKNDKPNDALFTSKLISWNGDQSAEIAHVKLNDGTPATLLENVNSGGDFAAQCQTSGNNTFLATHEITFDCAFSEHAKLNLYIDANDATLERLFVTITGPDHNAPDLRKIGSATMTPIPGKTTAGRPWYRVRIPLARLIHDAFPWLANLTADCFVLGMLHEGYLNAGINGNFRGEWFLIANPTLTTISPEDYAKLPKEQRIQAVPNAPGSTWDMGPIAIAFTGNDAFTPVLRNGKLTIDTYSVLLSDKNSTYADRILTVKPAMLPVTRDKTQVKFQLSIADATSKAPIECTWTTTTDFSKDKTPPTRPSVNPTYAFLNEPGKALEDTYLQLNSVSDSAFSAATRDNGMPAVTTTARISGARSHLAFKLPRISLEQAPYLVADVKIPKTTLVDVATRTTNGQFTIGLSDNDTTVQYFTGQAPDFNNDGEWQTIKLPLLDASKKILTDDKSTFRRLNTLLFGNFGYAGTFPGASYQVSNLRLARTASATQKHPLTLYWNAFDYAGVNAYAYSWSENPKDDPSTANPTPYTSATFTNLKPGLAFFHIKARDVNGNWSDTTHVPFFIDNATPTATPALPTPNALAAPDELKIKLSKDCMGHITDKAVLKINGKECRLTNTSLSYDDKNTTLTWSMLTDYSLLATTYADKTPFKATVENLTNAAGTPLPTCEWSWTLDFSKDNKPPHPPTFYYNQSYMSSYFQHFNTRTAAASLPTSISNQSIVVDEITKSPCLQFTPKERSFLAHLTRGAISPGTVRYVRFKCRIAPKTTVNAYIYSPLGCHQITMTGPEERTVVGKLDVKADNQWRTLTIDLEDVYKVVPDLRTKRINRISIGLLARTRNMAQQVRLDDVAAIPIIPPAAACYGYAVDASGIQSISYSLTQDENATPPMTAVTTSQTRKLLAKMVMDKPGIWYLKLKCKDGAGNESETITAPIHCVAPAQMTASDSIDNLYENWSHYQINPKSKVRSHATPLKLNTPSVNNPVLTLSFPGYKRQNVYFAAKLPAERIRPFLNGFTADVHVATSKPITVTPVVLNKYREIIASGKEYTLKSSDAWQRNVQFSFSKLPSNAEFPVYIGFMTAQNQRITGSLSLDNIICKPASK